MAERMLLLETGDRFVTLDRDGRPRVYSIENGEPVLEAEPGGGAPS